MSFMQDLAEIFDEVFAVYELNRMYPSGCRRESTMIKLSMNHVNAIVRAEFYVQGYSAKVPEPQMRKQLEDDLLRLAELKLYIIQQMTDQHQLFQEHHKADGRSDT